MGMRLANVCVVPYASSSLEAKTQVDFFRSTKLPLKPFIFKEIMNPNKKITCPLKEGPFQQDVGSSSKYQFSKTNDMLVWGE